MLSDLHEVLNDYFVIDMNTLVKNLGLSECLYGKLQNDITIVPIPRYTFWEGVGDYMIPIPYVSDIELFKAGTYNDWVPGYNSICLKTFWGVSILMDLFYERKIKSK
jgi:hypothetical protein